MIDARNIYRKVTRKIYDFSPEQLQHILSIVWLYRGETKRFHDLVISYISKSLKESVQGILLAQEYETVFGRLHKGLEPFLAILPKDGKQAEAVRELTECLQAYKDNCRIFAKLAQEKNTWWKKAETQSLASLPEMLKELELLATENNKLMKEAELMYRLFNRLIDVCLNEHHAKENGKWNAREIINLKKQTEEARDNAVSQLKRARYFHHQVEWLVERFPDEKLRDVEGLVKLVDKDGLKENDWSLTPGRYVGVAPEKEDPDFDFGEAMRTIHAELEDLNAQAADLAERISGNFKKLGI
ncbi:SAM-dependent DNA methyltransferase [Candidatus Brocadia pituitae]|nr:SAM-dependent DNA methyltransferase [Candidatus Brocadia pituitae]